jgi:hypothetical protein
MVYYRRVYRKECAAFAKIGIDNALIVWYSIDIMRDEVEMT